MKLLHAFAPNMLVNAMEGRTLVIRKVDINRTKTLLKENGLESHVGRRNLAAILSNLLGQNVVFAPSAVKLEAGELAIVMQYQGPRIHDDAIEMPAGGDMHFFTLRVKPPDGRGYNTNGHTYP